MKLLEEKADCVVEYVWACVDVHTCMHMHILWSPL